MLNGSTVRVRAGVEGADGSQARLAELQRRLYALLKLENSLI